VLFLGYGFFLVLSVVGCVDKAYEFIVFISLLVTPSPRYPLHSIEQGRELGETIMNQPTETQKDHRRVTVSVSGLLHCTV